MEPPPRVPEFMWCQRKDCVYLTIKVADCEQAIVDIKRQQVLHFSGNGHGAAGQATYSLCLDLAHQVCPKQSKYQVAGPSIKIKLVKIHQGPHWPQLLSGQKPPQCKVDWQSWLDEDEEHESSVAPNGFDENQMQSMMVGESIEFYRDPDKFSSSEEEGEETSSVMMDQGLNNMSDLDAKFKALDMEQKIRSLARADRHRLRKETRAAQLAMAERERDVLYNRPPRQLTEVELDLIEGAGTLRQRLKAQKKAEAAYWASKPHHQMRPAEKSLTAARTAARLAAVAALEEYRGRIDCAPGLVDNAESRRRTRHFIRAAALEAAFHELGHKDAAPVAAHEIAAAVARDVLGEPMPPPSYSAAEAVAVAAAEAAGLAHDGISAPEDEVVAAQPRMTPNGEEAGKESDARQLTPETNGVDFDATQDDGTLLLEDNDPGVEV